MGRWGAFALAVTIAACAPAEARTKPPVPLANHCFTIAAGKRYVTAAGDGYSRAAKKRRKATRFHLKPTGLGTYLVYDSGERLLATGAKRVTIPGPAAEWAIKRRSTLRSTLDGRALTLDRRSRFRFARARGCKRYPEAALGASGKPPRSTRPDGTLVGYADPHLHVTADLRAGGEVIAGESFDRFGITEALGHDADVHGSDGSLDITGNLLRGGDPAGTHDPHGWPTFAGWPTFDTYTHQQIYYRWLQRAWMGGLRLTVAQTVEDQPLCEIEPRKSHSCDETETIELEVRRLKQLQDYVDAQSGGRGRGWFRLVYTPRGARRAIAGGKLAVIIGMESSNPFGCSQFRGQPACDRGDIDRGIARVRKIGVRSVFVAHWVDNALAGAALEGGDKGTFISAMQAQQTGGPFVFGPCPYPGQGEEVQSLPIGRQCNTAGLTELGDYAVRRLMDNHMLIEVDHMSERARDRVLEIAAEGGYPLVSSHTGTGGTWAPEELRALFATGGFASATLDAAANLPGKLLAFRRQYGTAATPGLSSDTGGFAALPAPSGGAPLAYPFRSYAAGVRFTRQRTGERVFDLNTDGVAHYGLVPDLLADVQRQADGPAALDLLFHSADAYLRTWQRAVR